MKKRGETALVPVVTRGTDLVPSDARMVVAAERLGWKATTLLARIQEHLPAVIEAHIYLELAASTGMRPRTFANMLRTLFGEQELTPDDFEDRSVGPNLVSSPGSQAIDVIQRALALSDSSALEELGIKLSSRQAARLAICLGDSAPDFFEALAGEIDEVAEFLCMEFDRRDKVAWVVVETLLLNAASVKPQFIGITPLGPLELLQQFADAFEMVASVRRRSRRNRRVER